MFGAGVGWASADLGWARGGAWLGVLCAKTSGGGLWCNGCKIALPWGRSPLGFLLRKTLSVSGAMPSGLQSKPFGQIR